MQGNSGSVSSQAKNIKISNLLLLLLLSSYIHTYFNDLIPR